MEVVLLEVILEVVLSKVNNRTSYEEDETLNHPESNSLQNKNERKIK